jgi:hypothetical protein
MVGSVSSEVVLPFLIGRVMQLSSAGDGALLLTTSAIAVLLVLLYRLIVLALTRVARYQNAGCSVEEGGALLTSKFKM